MNNFNGLLVVSCELTSICNKNPGCFCCGRRKLEKERPELCQWGNMDFKLVELIAKQLPPNIILSAHVNGDPLCYPRLKEALHRFKHQIRVFNTNAIALLEKADSIIDNMESLTISVIENDPLGDEQYKIVKKFLEIKGNKKPMMVYRLLGNVENAERWYKLPGTVATRILHSPMGSFDYTKKVTIPEIGCCLDILSHMVVNRFGLVSLCVRFDPYNELVIGDAKTTSLEDIWNGEKRKYLIQEHLKGNRSCNPVCAKCHFWGCPTGNG